MGMLGKQSIKFEHPAHIIDGVSIVGPKEGEGPLGELFYKIVDDPMMGENTWEMAESDLQQMAVQELLNKCKMSPEKIRYIFGGDLLGQLIATTFGIESFNIPFFGLYGACSTMGEGLSLGAMTVAAGYADNVVAMASSHFASAEKNFRFPLEYANQRHASATWTVTGCGSVLLGKEGGFAKVTGITTGKIVDYGVKDTQNMGAAMAPAAADVIYAHMEDFKTTPGDYDKIITGDLGYVGQKILIDLLKDKGIDISVNHMDCGIEIYDYTKQGTNSGGSGCGCSATVLTSMIFDKLRNGEYKKILFIPTGALMSPVSFNEGKSIPGIAHLVQIEKL